MGFVEIANSPLLYILVIIGLLCVTIFAAIFLKRSYGQCLKLGIEKKMVNNVIKSSLAFSVVPSIAIVIGLLSLVVALGVPWPWWRLSVLGSVSYELMAADMAAKGMNYASIADMVQANDPKVFGAIMYVMTIGILGGFTILIPFGKKMTTGLMSVRQKKDNSWGVVMGQCFMLTMLAVFLPLMIVSDIVSTATLITSAFITFLLGILIKKYNISWLNNFVLAIALLLSMISSVGWDSIFN